MSLAPLPNGSVTSPRGFRAGAVHAGLKPPAENARDLAILTTDGPTTGAGVFTQNRITAAPVVVSRGHLGMAAPRAVVVNSGCANAAVGEQGLTDARETARLAAAKLGIRPEEVLVCSTGVIGVELPMDIVGRGIGAVALSDDAGHDFARAIMTTDTREKESAVSVEIGGREVIVAGAAKGAGMIHPDMATMLVFITTDAAVEQDCLRRVFNRAVSTTFNMISVDGDTSTNDTVLVFANGQAGNAPVSGGADETALEEALTHVCRELSRAIVRDGEGATKLIEINIEGARSDDEARRAARAISKSVLVKTAVFGADPNWGRVMMALGNSGVEVEESRVTLLFNDMCVLENGRAMTFDRDAAVELMRQPEVRFDVRMGLASGRATAWTCDLSYEYVRINGEYTT